MNNKDVSVGNANTNAAHDSDKCMSDEQAKIALAIINQPDSRFSSIGENEQSIAQSVAMCNLVQECSQNGTAAFADHFVAHVRLVKKNALHDQMRKIKTKTRDKNTGEIEYGLRMVYDTEGNEENASTSIGNRVAETTSGSEPMEEDERQKAILSLYSNVKMSVKDMPADMRAKRAFLLYMGGMSYVGIARTVYGYSNPYNNPETKTIYTNKVSCAIHSICLKLRKIYGEEAKMILRPVVHAYERYL